MRIIHLISHLRLGAGRAIVDLAVEQCRGRGHDVWVLVSSDAEGTWRSDAALLAELDDAGVRTSIAGDFFHRDPVTLAASARMVRRIVSPWTPRTVVHAHTAMAVAVARWAGAPRVVATCHGWNLERPADYDLQDALALSSADCIISPSRHWATRVSALPLSPDVTVIPCGFDLTRYRRVAFNPASARLRIACLGELTHRKGQDLLIDAMPGVWTRCPEAELHLFGDGDRAESLRERARQIDPAARIFFHGHVHDGYDRLAEYDLLCLPSRSDNQPVAIVEAMLAAVPVVASNVGGIGELVDDAGCGQLVAPESVQALADAIVNVATRPDRQALGVRGARYARRHHDVRLVAARIAACYEATPAIRDVDSGAARAHIS